MHCIATRCTIDWRILTVNCSYYRNNIISEILYLKRRETNHEIYNIHSHQHIVIVVLTDRLFLVVGKLRIGEVYGILRFL